MRKIHVLSLMTAVALAVTPALAEGPADYKAKCQMCHAADASGNTPAGKKLGAKDLKLPETKNKTDTELVAIVRDGKNKMPSFKEKLNAQQMQELVTFIRKLAK